MRLRTRTNTGGDYLGVCVCASVIMPLANYTWANKQNKANSGREREREGSSRYDMIQLRSHRADIADKDIRRKERAFSQLISLIKSSGILVARKVCR